MRHAILLGCAPFALTACLLAGDGLELERAEQSLSFTTVPHGLPEIDELPDCWWAERGKVCEHRCGDEPDPAPSRPVRASSIVAAASTPARALDLPIRGPIQCPRPDGVVVCPHCRRMSQAASVGVFKLHPQVDTRVVIANASGAYRIVSLPVLASPPSIVDPPAKYVNLAGGTVISQQGTVDFDEDLYLLFGLGDEQEAVPANYWTACPADGSDCEIVLP